MSVRARSQRGIAAVEFGLLLVPLLLLIFAIVEFGRAMYEYQILTKSARAAARMLSTRQPADPKYAQTYAEALCLAQHGTLDCSGPRILPGITPGMLAVCDPARCPATHADQAIGAQAVNFVTVTVGTAAEPYVFRSFVPFGLPAALAFSPVSVTMRQLR